MADDVSNNNLKIQSLPGMRDMLPDDHEYFTFIKKVIRHRSRQNGFRRISVPVLEQVELFDRSVGEASDIGEKELYKFIDRGNRSIALRPEITAGICRSYIENGMKDWPQPVNLYEISNAFRYDKPQKGRYREFWQWDVESIGEKDPALDVDMIRLAWNVLSDLGLSDDLIIYINSLGTPENRKQYIEDLTNFLASKERNLCEDCKRRMTTNPLRVLDCKDEDCQIIAGLAPKMFETFDEATKLYFEKVKEYLDEIEIPYEIDPTLVRGLDYYTDTIFEISIKSKEGKRQNSIGGGGRYDKLIELLGGEPTPGIGFGIGMDRVIELMKDKGYTVPHKDDIQVFIVQLGDQAKKKCFKLIDTLRDLGIKTRYSVGTDSLKAQLRMADRLDAKYALIIGQIEARDNIIIIRDMVDAKQQTVPFDSVAQTMKDIIGKDKLDFFDPSKELIKS